MEFLERLEILADYEERWLVQAPGASEPHVAWFFHNREATWLAQTNELTRPLFGPIHPRACTIFGSTWHGESLVFEVEDDRGPTLAAAAQQLADPAERERWVVAQFIGIADALAALRGRVPSFIYRQLEPDRLFVDVQGHAKLRAPIARVVQGPRPNYMGAAVVLGSPAYMAPEQALGGEVTAAADVFSLASNLYFALSGRRPFEREGMMEELVAVAREEHAPLELHTRGLRAVLDRAFAKDAANRHPDPGTFGGELWQCVPDATDYDAVISDKIVAWRPTATTGPARTEMLGGARCRMKWEQLKPTQSADVRHCGGCGQDVVRVRSIAEVVPLLGSRCVSYGGGD